MTYKKQLLFSVFLLLVCNRAVNALGQFNWLRPYDTLLRPDQKICQGLQLNTYAEFGVKNATGYNLFREPTNVLQIFNKTQNALAMLNGFAPNSSISILNTQINATDNGTRGHFVVTGDLKMDWAFALSSRYFFWENFCFSLYLPFYGLKLTNVTWKDETSDQTAEDLRVKELLTDDIFSNAATLGGLCLQDWRRQGPGDLVALIEFFKDFPQEERRPMLKEVDLNGRFGFNLPTGKKQNEDLLMAVPFGYDGAYGIFGGAGIDILLAYIMKLGLDVELLHLFGNTRERRIKTSIDQTELLLLQKVSAYKDWGLYQRFNLYAKVYNCIGGAGLKLGYQFFKHDADSLSFETCAFSTNVANTAPSLQEWVMHHIYVVADYDFSVHMNEDRKATPYISAYARIPFKGKNIALIPVIGANISISF
ncbi:MAG: hypothetical protein M1114_04295 [Candidatus Dependentiae bacterium]|nr:hypothetical protein [Candidatus Dependentiae bacterium]